MIIKCTLKVKNYTKLYKKIYKYTFLEKRHLKMDIFINYNVVWKSHIMSSELLFIKLL